MKNYILASASPRRRELLGELGITPAVCPTDADETIEEKLTPDKFVRVLQKERRMPIRASSVRRMSLSQPIR